MKKTLCKIVLAIAVLAFASCNSYKQVAYFQNIDEISLAASKGLYDARIKPKDQLTISVHTSDPAAATPFNLSISNTLSNTDITRLTTSQQTLLPYLVDNEGYINFPTLGKLHVEGLTKNECQDLIKNKIKPFLTDSEEPVVTVTMSSFRVTIMGAVNSPRVVSVTTEKMSMLEAIAQAGDLNIYGRRENVLLIREDATGEKHQYRINLTDAEFINSPYYYLQQNDIVYVEPNKTMAKNSDIGQSTTIWFSLVSVMVSVTSLLVNILR